MHIHVALSMCLALRAKNVLGTTAKRQSSLFLRMPTRRLRESYETSYGMGSGVNLSHLYSRDPA
jgi:hypothetical protein